MNPANAIRGRRRALGLTLVELAEGCGLSHPFLSQVENGRAQPSMDSLRRIAEALGTTPQALFGSSDGRPEPVVVRRAEAPTLDAPGAAAGSVVRLLLGGAVPFHLVELEGLPRRFQDHWSHDGHEAIYVIRGRVEIDLGGAITPLGLGDSISYAATTPHRLRETGRGRAAVLLVESPPNDGGSAHGAP